MNFKVALSQLLLTALAKADETISYTSPDPANYKHHFLETFDQGIPKSFIHTTGTKQDEDSNKYAGEFVAVALKSNALPDDLGLVAPKKAKHYGIASALDKKFVFADEENEQLIVSYEVNFQEQIDCGGGYLKLFADTPDLDLTAFHDKTLFSIMFGPDKCAKDAKLHLILNHKNPITGEFEEKHLAKMPDGNKVLMPYYTDAATHVYKLVLTRKDSLFEIFIDDKSVSKGSLLKDMKPAVNPPEMIVDADSVKPDDWDGRKMINDPAEEKPEDWDEEAPKEIADLDAKMPADWREDIEMTVDDPDAIMPEDWDEDMDGEYEAPQIDNVDCKDISGCGAWEPPMIKNPAHKGKWHPTMIDNPDYSGKWEPANIKNPNYFVDENPFNTAQSIAAVAIEIWTMSENFYFDNIMISNDAGEVGRFVKDTHGLKVKQVKVNQPSMLDKMKTASEDKGKWIIGSVLGIGVFTILIYFACFKKAKDTKNVQFSDETHEKVISAENSEHSANEATPASNSNDDQNSVDESDTNASQTNLGASKENLAAGDSNEKIEKNDKKEKEKEGSGSESDESEEESESEAENDGEVEASSEGDSSDEILIKKNAGPRKRNMRRKAD